MPGKRKPVRSESSGLGAYRDKRTAERTPEPFGGEGAPRPGAFVVQKHAARRTHYDLRLEMGGALKSWAVPKGPCLDPQEKRLAVETEDHPVEYVDFEGIIPEGNYGAGAMIVWDQGTWVALEDPKEGFERGKLLFELRGYKLRGVWTLFRTSKQETGKEWLLVKKPDGWARDKDEPLPEASVFSGLTVEELRDGVARSQEIRDELEKLDALRNPVRPEEIDLMLAHTEERPFNREGWLFELKYDGFRLLAARGERTPKLLYRRGNDATQVFPELARALLSLPTESVILDGEVVVLDEESRPSFQRLQKRVQLTRPRDLERASKELPATFFAFDLLAFEGFDLRPLPLVQRKALLQRFLPPAGPLRFCDHIEERGEDFYRAVQEMGLEGMVAKRGDAPYVGGRSSHWLKIRIDRVGDFAVVGFTQPEGSRTGFGALHLACWSPDESDKEGHLVYAGRVGTGFNENQLREIAAVLEASRRPDPPCTGLAPKGPKHAWVEPELICEVRFKEWTEEGLLRQPAFLRLRDDKALDECVREAELAGRLETDLAVASEAAATQSREKVIHFTNLDKVFWPEEGYTKGDLIEFYRAVAPRMLPYLEDRPVVLTRYPDGINGKSFFQKNAPEFAPDWIKTEKIWSKESERDIEYFICDDVEALLYLANLGSIPLHMWSSRLAAIDRPDWCILDLDPKQAPFKDVVTVARAVRSLCTEIGLESFIKTSGSTGLHVLIPLGAQYSYEQSRLLGQLIARLTARELPEIATTTRHVQKREGKVYLDYVQNGHGRLLVAPFSVRPLPGAPVSTPLKWTEVTSRLDPNKLTLRTVPRRLKKLKDDPLTGLLTATPDLDSALARLADKLEG